MIKFFTNRELSHNLDINLARWKRWSREFLPPDPLGGLQSGYARQYSPNEAFTVHLGGHLVSNFKFSIPEAKQILQDLHGWLADNGFYFDAKGSVNAGKSVDRMVKKYLIFIAKGPDAIGGKVEFHYMVRGIISNRPIHYEGFDLMQELYIETLIGSRTHQSAVLETNTIKTLSITAFLNRFVNRMDLDPTHYPTLHSPESGATNA